MLIAHGLLPDLVSQLSSYSLFGISPIWWDQNEGQFKVKKSAITCIGSVITFQLGLVLIIHDLYRQYQLAANTNAGESSSSSGIERGYNRVQRISCALLLFMVAVIHCRNMRSAHAIAMFFNGMIAFEQKYTGKLCGIKQTKRCCFPSAFTFFFLSICRTTKTGNGLERKNHQVFLSFGSILQQYCSIADFYPRSLWRVQFAPKYCTISTILPDHNSIFLW